MADQGHVENLLFGTADPLRRILVAVFRYVLKDLRFGRAEDGEPAMNLGGGFYETTTPTVANTEFTVVHAFGRTPYLLIPVLPLDEAGAKIVRLETARAADANRIYLKSPETSSLIRFYLEG